MTAAYRVNILLLKMSRKQSLSFLAIQGRKRPVSLIREAFQEGSGDDSDSSTSEEGNSTQLGSLEMRMKMLELREREVALRERELKLALREKGVKISSPKPSRKSGRRKKAVKTRSGGLIKPKPPQPPSAAKRAAASSGRRRSVAAIGKPEQFADEDGLKWLPIRDFRNVTNAIEWDDPVQAAALYEQHGIAPNDCIVRSDGAGRSIGAIGLGTNWKGYSAGHHACVNGSVETLRWFVKLPGVDLEQRCRDGINMLQYCKQEQEYVCEHILLEALGHPTTVQGARRKMSRRQSRKPSGVMRRKMSMLAPMKEGGSPRDRKAFFGLSEPKKKHALDVLASATSATL